MKQWQRDKLKHAALEALGVEPTRWRMSYVCGRCRQKWEEVWVCQCNSRCPGCDREHDPYHVEGIYDE